jgi:hypothetical protein
MKVSWREIVGVKVVGVMESWTREDLWVQLENPPVATRH